MAMTSHGGINDIDFLLGYQGQLLSIGISMAMTSFWDVNGIDFLLGYQWQ